MEYITKENLIQLINILILFRALCGAWGLGSEASGFRGQALGAWHEAEIFILRPIKIILFAIFLCNLRCWLLFASTLNQELRLFIL